MNCAMAGKTTAAPVAMASKIKESFRMIVRQWPNTLLCRKRHGLVVGEGWHSGGGVCGCRRKWSGSFLSRGKVLRFHLGGLERHRRFAPTCRAPTGLCFIPFGNLGRCPRLAWIRTVGARLGRFPCGRPFLLAGTIQLEVCDRMRMECAG